MVNRNSAKKENKGLIFDIQRYSVHDGPGIRTNIFFKGCSMRCKWCCNPESWEMQPELAHFNSKCNRCGECVEACPNNAIALYDSSIKINHLKCNLCGMCVNICKKSAYKIFGNWYSVTEVFKEIYQDVDFYKASGGGVTFTGGEPTLQLDFLINLAKICKNSFIHTALETGGYFNWKKTNPLFDYIDLILFDLKVMNPDKHLEFTGVKNKLILKNVENIVGKTSCEVIIRVPIIPNYTFGSDNLKIISEFMLNLKKIKEIHLLPFHQYGKSKYEAIGKDYELKMVKPLQKEKLYEWEEYFNSLGFITKIGG